MDPKPDYIEMTWHIRRLCAVGTAASAEETLFGLTRKMSHAGRALPTEKHSMDSNTNTLPQAVERPALRSGDLLGDFMSTEHKPLSEISDAEFLAALDAEMKDHIRAGYGEDGVFAINYQFAVEAKRRLEKARAVLEALRTKIGSTAPGEPVYLLVPALKSWCAQIDSALGSDLSRCTYVLRQSGKPYPRTCEVCGLGPCRNAACFT